jgi:hypothetical protein
MKRTTGTKSKSTLNTNLTAEEQIMKAAKEARSTMGELRVLLCDKSWVVSGDVMTELYNVCHEIQTAALQTAKELFPNLHLFKELPGYKVAVANGVIDYDRWINNND